MQDNMFWKKIKRAKRKRSQSFVVPRLFSVANHDEVNYSDSCFIPFLRRRTTIFFLWAQKQSMKVIHTLVYCQNFYDENLLIFSRSIFIAAVLLLLRTSLLSSKRLQIQFNPCKAIFSLRQSFVCRPVAWRTRVYRFQCDSRKKVSPYQITRNERGKKIDFAFTSWLPIIMCGSCNMLLMCLSIMEKNFFSVSRWNHALPQPAVESIKIN